MAEQLPGNPRDTDDPTSAIVLSGGGTRISFELGALSYLYQVERVNPRILAGTSAGAILAALLAQGPDRDSQADLLDRAIAYFAAVPTVADLFAPGPLRDQLSGLTPEKQRQRRHRLSRAKRSRFERRHQKVTSRALRAARARSTEPRAGAPTNALDVVRAFAHLGIDPTHLGGGFGQAQAIFEPGPILRDVTSPPLLDEAKVASSGVTLRISLVGLESGDLRYVTEQGALVNRRDMPVAPPATTSLGDGVLASCALPGFLAPVEISGEHYVDGGIREFLPTSIVTERMDADRVYAVCTRPLAFAPEANFARRSLVDIMSRAYGSISADEVLRDEVERAEEAGVVLIHPVESVHDALEYDRGLTEITFWDGWMAAAAACTGTPGGALAGAEITRLRQEIWRQEEELIGPYVRETDDPHEGGGAGTAASPAPTVAIGRALDAVSGLPAHVSRDLAPAKRRLARAISEAPAGLLPPHAPAWAQGWELHYWRIDSRPEW